MVAISSKFADLRNSFSLFFQNPKTEGYNYYNLSNSPASVIINNMLSYYLDGSEDKRLSVIMLNSIINLYVRKSGLSLTLDSYAITRNYPSVVPGCVIDLILESTDGSFVSLALISQNNALDNEALAACVTYFHKEKEGVKGLWLTRFPEHSSVQGFYNATYKELYEAIENQFALYMPEVFN